MRNLDETTITQAVLATHHSAADGRLSEVMTSLVQHLHAFARDIKLTEQEWQHGVAFLEQVANIGTGLQPEFALLSHVLGLSTLVLAQNRPRTAVGTEPAAFDSQPDCPAESQHQIQDQGTDISATTAGPRLWVQASVHDTKARPVPYAAVQISSSGQDMRPALLQADGDGQVRFSTALPQPYRVVEQGAVNTLLAALDRHAWRPAHLEFVIRASGYRPLTTLVFRDDDPYLGADALFGVRASLIAEWKYQDRGPAPDGSVSDQPFYTLSFDFVLAPA
ncbi:dioxygenase family protein [Pseudomonas sp. CFBP 8772]|uniref:dioxygenase family protein n=1 Tax=Pseudomonas sp. CFBP 8772 TaxID=2775284 RepID=UPI0017829531|nr:dioxygenase [Pseudomonas sp. CFBP 8772]MBD8599021.1 6-chlorohydroxyquinol-1,2-dioxygenase [Pseudomonas sp. CFBP 8772]